MSLRYCVFFCSLTPHIPEPNAKYTAIVLRTCSCFVSRFSNTQPFHEEVEKVEGKEDMRKCDGKSYM